MSLRATARTAARAAFRAAGDALIKVQIYLGPIEDDYDPESDQSTRSWEQVSTPIDALPYQDKKSRRNDDRSIGLADPEKTTRSFVVLGTSIAVAKPDQEGEIREIKTGTVYQISEIETDPTNSIYIFHTTA